MAGIGSGGGVIGSVKGAHVLIIEARYYDAIADALIADALEELDAAGVTYERVAVPGALEIPQVLAAAIDAELAGGDLEDTEFDGAIALGCVIRGETAHYDIVCNNANHWLMEQATRFTVPFGNGILTVDTEVQAIERAKGGRQGKGGAAARACLRMIELQREFLARFEEGV